MSEGYGSIVEDALYQAGYADGLEAPREQPTLRDRFAMAAMQGIVMVAGNNDFVSLNYGNIAEDAYKAADAMLAQREVKP